MSGKLYGVGVGPGDPKLMTYLAVETIKNCPVIAVPADEMCIRDSRKRWTSGSRSI